MATADLHLEPALAILPERERVCLRLGATLDARALSQLEREACGLIDRGFKRLTIELQNVETVDWTTAATLAAINRAARQRNAQLTVIAGDSCAIQELMGAGLLQDLPFATSSRAYFDWTR